MHQNNISIPVHLDLWTVDAPAPVPDQKAKPDCARHNAEIEDRAVFSRSVDNAYYSMHVLASHKLHSQRWSFTARKPRESLGGTVCADIPCAGASVTQNRPNFREQTSPEQRSSDWGRHCNFRLSFTQPW